MIKEQKILNKIIKEMKNKSYLYCDKECIRDGLDSLVAARTIEGWISMLELLIIDEVNDDKKESS